jgi:uroporphyrinogen-III decarboxylase
METKSTRVMIEGTSILANEAEVPVAAFMTGPITFSLQLMPYEVLIKMMIKNTEFTHKLVKKSVMVIKEYIKALKKAGTTLFVVCEHDFQILKSEQIKEYSLDYLPNLFDIYDYNILHICGKVAPLLNVLAHDLKQIKNLNTLNIGPFVDITKTQELLNHKIGVAGNIDHIRLLPLGSPKEVQNAVHKAIEASGRDSRFMVAPGCEITSDTPIENVKAFVKATQTFYS